MVHCVPHLHLMHAVWEPLAEYAELQQSEQNHTQPKLHPATVSKNSLAILRQLGSESQPPKLMLAFPQVRLAWLCNSLFDNVGISSSPFAKNKLLVCTPYLLALLIYSTLTLTLTLKHITTTNLLSVFSLER